MCKVSAAATPEHAEPSENAKTTEAYESNVHATPSHATPSGEGALVRNFSNGRLATSSSAPRTLGDVHETYERAPLAHRAKLPKEQLTELERENASCKTVMRGWLPIVEWLPQYGKDCKYHAGTLPFSRGNSLYRDVIAGVVIGVMLIPQGMAYAMLAGLPPIYGLYSSTWTLVTYMLFGTCKYLGPGVNAPISLLVVDSLSNALNLKTGCGDDTSSPECRLFAESSMLICLMVGVLYVIMAVCQLGVVTSFMPEPALSGFTTGAAVIIITSNMKYFLGMVVPRGGVLATWGNIFELLGEGKLNATALVIGVAAFFTLFAIQAFNRHPKIKGKLPIPVPEQLVVLIATTLISYGFSLNTDSALPVVGDIPAGLYTPRMPFAVEIPVATTVGNITTIAFSTEAITMDRISALVPASITIAIVTYILTINVAKAVASESNIAVDANQELRALAAQSFVGGFTGSCVPSGSFSRTALITSMEAESPLHNMFSCVVVMLVSLFMTSLLYHLPKATLAAIIFVALKNMIKVDVARKLWTFSKLEWLQWMVACFATVVFGVTGGIVASIALSVLMLLRQASRPTTSVLGVLPGTEVFVCNKRYPSAQELVSIKLFRFEGSLNFANKDWFELKLEKMLRQDTTAAHARIHTIIVDGGCITTIDSSAVRMLERVATTFSKRDMALVFANWSGVDEAGQAVFEHFKFSERLMELDLERNFFLSLGDAVEEAEKRHARAQKTRGGLESDSAAAAGDYVAVIVEDAGQTLPRRQCAVSDDMQEHLGRWGAEDARREAADGGVTTRLHDTRHACE